MILSFSIECESLNEFLDHWSAKYHDPKFRDRDKYDPYVGSTPFTEAARLHLFEWKNGSILSRYFADVCQPAFADVPQSEKHDLGLIPAGEPKHFRPPIRVCGIEAAGGGAVGFVAADDLAHLLDAKSVIAIGNPHIELAPGMVESVQRALPHRGDLRRPSGDAGLRWRLLSAIGWR
jgi:hypothetical protein